MATGLVLFKVYVAQRPAAVFEDIDIAFVASVQDGQRYVFTGTEVVGDGPGLPGYITLYHDAPPSADRPVAVGGEGYILKVSNAVPLAPGAFQLVNLAADPGVVAAIGMFPPGTQPAATAEVGTMRKPGAAQLTFGGRAVSFMTWHAPRGPGQILLWRSSFFHRGVYPPLGVSRSHAARDGRCGMLRSRWGEGGRPCSVPPAETRFRMTRSRVSAVERCSRHHGGSPRRHGSGCGRSELRWC